MSSVIEFTATETATESIDNQAIPKLAEKVGNVVVSKDGLDEGRKDMMQLIFKGAIP